MTPQASKKAVIKAGHDERRTPVNGALTKWEDLVGICAGTLVEVIKECNETHIATISLPMGGSSPCGHRQYRPGQRRLVSLSALEYPHTEHLSANHNVATQNHMQPEFQRISSIAS